jgi:hypothetical protein
MQWEYLIETIYANNPPSKYQEQLAKLGDAEWEAVTSWHQYPNSNANTYILLKRPKSSK